jgi:hypothetical protein
MVVCPVLAARAPPVIEREELNVSTPAPVVDVKVPPEIASDVMFMLAEESVMAPVPLSVVVPETDAVAVEVLIVKVPPLTPSVPLSVRTPVPVGPTKVPPETVTDARLTLPDPRVIWLAVPLSDVAPETVRVEVPMAKIPVALIVSDGGEIATAPSVVVPALTARFPVKERAVM